MWPQKEQNTGLEADILFLGALIYSLRGFEHSQRWIFLQRDVFLLDYQRRLDYLGRTSQVILIPISDDKI